MGYQQMHWDSQIQILFLVATCSTQTMGIEDQELVVENDGSELLLLLLSKLYIRPDFMSFLYELHFGWLKV